MTETDEPIEAATRGDGQSPPSAVFEGSELWKNLLDSEQSITVQLGHTETSMGTAMEWTEGSLIELDKVSGEGVDVLVNDRLCFRGEVVVVGENFGIRITEVVKGDEGRAGAV